MQLLDHKINTFSLAELFFTEKAIELLHRLTIDTYRSRVVNPRSILVELSSLLADDTITNPKQYQYAVIEARNLLLNENENILNFEAISKSHFISLISNLENKPTQKDKNDVLLAINVLILQHNKNYGQNLLNVIVAHLNAFNVAAVGDEKFTYFERLQTLIAYFTTELTSSGFSKRFLYRFISDHFASKEATTFSDGITALRTLLLMRSKNFQIIFKLEMASTIAANINFIDPSNSKLTDNIEDIIDSVPVGVSEKVKNKLANFARKTFRSPQFLRISLRALDSFAALEKARISLSENLDLIHLGYSKEEVFPEKGVLIMEENSPGNYYYQFRTLQYELDGNFRDGVLLYSQFSSRISSISQDPRVEISSKEKLKSAIRYLRIGNAAIEVEHKFLNYWIGMEYLFSDLKDRSDINDIKKYFSRIHSNIFLNRILNDFHINIYRMRKHIGVPGYNRYNIQLK